MTTVGISAGWLRATVVPAMGGAISSFEHDGLPLLRAWDGSADPATTASFPLVPWSGRIAGGGFSHAGRFHPLTANWPADPFPIHGDGWQRSWAADQRDGRSVRMVLDDGGPPPWRYRAVLDYRLDAATLTMALEVEHRGEEPLPYGLGFHPWFPRTPGTRLHAAATHVWLEDERYLPTQQVALATRPGWDFSVARTLPPGWINNVFEGWGGAAEIAWPERRLGLRIEAATPLDRYLVYSPSAAAGFFCFEPISHPVDALHLDGMPGLRVLAPGERLEARCRLTALAESR